MGDKITFSEVLRRDLQVWPAGRTSEPITHSHPLVEMQSLDATTTTIISTMGAAG